MRYMLNQKIEADSPEPTHTDRLSGNAKERRDFIKAAIASVPVIITLSAGSVQAGSGAGSGVGSGPDQTGSFEDTSSTDSNEETSSSDFSFSNYDRKDRKYWWWK
jgi:hypothetical protein